MGVYVLDEADGVSVQVRGLVEGRSLQVLNIGVLTDRAPGESVLGRVVPISVHPHGMFESRPCGRLDWGFSCSQGTLFSSAIVPVRAGRDVANGVGVDNRICVRIESSHVCCAAPNGWRRP